MKSTSRRRWTFVALFVIVSAIVLVPTALAMDWDGCSPIPGLPDYQCTLCTKHVVIGSTQCSISMIYCSDGYKNTISNCW